MYTLTLESCLTFGLAGWLCSFRLKDVAAMAASGVCCRISLFCLLSLWASGYPPCCFALALTYGFPCLVPQPAYTVPLGPALWQYDFPFYSSLSIQPVFSAEDNNGDESLCHFCHRLEFCSYLPVWNQKEERNLICCIQKIWTCVALKQYWKLIIPGARIAAEKPG